MSDAWTLVLAFASLLVLTVGLLALAWRRRRLGVASFALLVLAAVAWGLAVVAITTGVDDADGFIDCRRDCTLTHRLTALGLVAPPLLVSIAAGGMMIALVARARARPSMDENRG